MNDLKLIEELLCDIKWMEPNKTWLQVEVHSSATERAMDRLRKAWFAQKLEQVTLSLAMYFEKTKDYERLE